jgi:DNA repair exonuclease SbcCD nuclease subunit
MRAVITADWHLGFKAFAAACEGRNQREIDVERACVLAVDKIVELRPDLVLIGNHDVGRTAEVLTPIVMPDDYERVHIVTEPKRIRLSFTDPDLGQTEKVSIACFPFTARTNGEVYALDPEEGCTNVLLLHAAVRGEAGADKLPWFYMGYHEFTRLHPTALACYPGSLERTSSNIWEEHAAKGIVLADTVTKTLEFHEIPTRPMRDLLWQGEASAQSLNFMLEGFNAETPHGYDPGEGAIVRLVVPDFPRAEKDQVDRQLVREIQKRALHFQLDVRYRKDEIGEGASVIRKGISLQQAMAEFFKDDPPEVRELVEKHIALQTEVELEEAVA